MELPSFQIEYTSRRGPFVGSEHLDVEFGASGAATKLGIDRAHGIVLTGSIPVLVPLQGSTIESTAPSADVLRGAQLLRAAALAAGGVSSVHVETTKGTKDVHWTLADGSSHDARFADAPAAIRDVIASAKGLHKVITGGVFGRTDPSFHAARR
jgi:hypothetical protein